MTNQSIPLNNSITQANKPLTNGVSPASNGSAGQRPSVLDDFPTLSAALLDWAWVFEHREQGGFDAYGDRHVAVIERQVVCSGSDPGIVRDEAARRFQVEPERVVVFFVDGADFSVP